jgi:hypothetical protein
MNKKEIRYQHDCEKCKFLGQFQEFDLYWCESFSSPTLDSLLARYGSDGPKYLSSHPPGAFSGVPFLHDWYVEILSRAEKEKLYDPEKAGTEYKVILIQELDDEIIYQKRGNKKEAKEKYEEFVNLSKKALLYEGGNLIAHNLNLKNSK